LLLGGAVGQRRSRPTADQGGQVRFHPPDGLTAYRVESGGSEFVVFEWSLPSIPRRQLSFTRTEQAVVELALDGLSNAEIADRRACSVHTIANELGAVYAKLGVHSREELMAWAASAGCNDV